MEAYLEDNRPTLDEVCMESEECTEECPAYEFCHSDEDNNKPLLDGCCLEQIVIKNKELLVVKFPPYTYPSEELYQMMEQLQKIVDHPIVLLPDDTKLEKFTKHDLIVYRDFINDVIEKYPEF